MTLFVASKGRRLTFKEIVTTTAPVTIFEVPSTNKALTYTVESISVVLKGADTSFTFFLSDGVDDVAIAAQTAFGSTSTWLMDDHHVVVFNGESLKFVAGGATEMHVVVVALETDTGGEGGR